MGCHFLLQYMKVKSESEVPQSYPTLRDPMDSSLPGSSVNGISQAKVLEWGAIAFSTTISLAYYKKIQLRNSQMEEMQSKVGGGVGAFRPSPGELPSQHLHMFISREAL